MKEVILKDVILEQHSEALPKNYVARQLDDQVDHLRKIDQIVIISGIRRCGKSTVLQLLRTKSAEQDYYLNFDDDRLAAFTVDDFQLLLELLIEIYGEQKTFYFDEIQNIPGWERFVRRLHNGGNKIYITGSNASLLSKELGTHLTGRTVQIEMFPFSFLEYLQFKKTNIPEMNKLTKTAEALFRKHFNEYIEQGGFPEYLANNSPLYLKTLYEGILYRDILVRHGINNEKVMKELVLYLASNIAKDTSYNALKNLLGLGSVTTISNYFEHLTNAYPCFTTNRFDASLKKQIQYIKKNYFIDTALARTVGFRTSRDLGRYLENIVFIELKRRGFGDNIYFHRGKVECDFVIRQGSNITTAIQVTQHLREEKTRLREINGLMEALDTYNLSEGFILTENETELIETNINASETVKIHILPIWKWLLSQ